MLIYLAITMLGLCEVKIDVVWFVCIACTYIQTQQLANPIQTSIDQPLTPNVLVLYFKITFPINITQESILVHSWMPTRILKRVRKHKNKGDYLTDLTDKSITVLTLSIIQSSIQSFWQNSVDPDEAARNGPSHQDLHCAQEKLTIVTIKPLYFMNGLV